MQLHKNIRKTTISFCLINTFVLTPQGLGSNLPADGWSLPKEKIMSALKYVNTATPTSLITNAGENVSNNNSWSKT